MTKTDEIEDSSAPLIEHLTELRNRIMWCLLAFVIAMVICFTVWKPIFDFLKVPLCQAMMRTGDSNCDLVFISLQEGFFMAFSISMMGGLVLAFPIISYQMWRFVAPGLYKTEKGAFLPFLVASPFMFFLGAVFAYYIVTPMAFDFFLSFQEPTTIAEGPGDAATVPGGLIYQGSAQSYLSLTIKFVLAFGLCFQLPVLLTLMGTAGLISAAGLAGVRRYAVVAILILAAVATPPDMMSQVILFAAVYPLYEVSILLIRRIEKKREAKLRAEGLWFDEEGDDAADDVTKP